MIYPYSLLPHINNPILAIEMIGLILLPEDLVLDTSVRDWVLIPLSVVMVLIGVLHYFVSNLMRSDQIPDLKIVKEGQVIIRARNLKAAANFIPPLPLPQNDPVSSFEPNFNFLIPASRRSINSSQFSRRKMRRPAYSSSPINFSAMTRKIDVDNRLSLRNYYRIADNILKQADIYREENNLIDLYVILLRYSSLVSETIPYHQDYNALCSKERVFYRKKLLTVLDELETLKPQVCRQLDQQKDISTTTHMNPL